jgi:hypothetical protein
VHDDVSKVGAASRAPLTHGEKSRAHGVNPFMPAVTLTQRGVPNLAALVEIDDRERHALRPPKRILVASPTIDETKATIVDRKAAIGSSTVRGFASP